MLCFKTLNDDSQNYKLQIVNSKPVQQSMLMIHNKSFGYGGAKEGYYSRLLCSEGDVFLRSGRRCSNSLYITAGTSDLYDFVNEMRQSLLFKLVQQLLLFRAEANIHSSVIVTDPF